MLLCSSRERNLVRFLLSPWNDEQYLARVVRGRKVGQRVNEGIIFLEVVTRLGHLAGCHVWRSSKEMIVCWTNTKFSGLAAVVRNSSRSQKY